MSLGPGSFSRRPRAALAVEGRRAEAHDHLGVTDWPAPAWDGGQVCVQLFLLGRKVSISHHQVSYMETGNDNP